MDTPSILIVDDEPNNFAVIEALLSDEDYELHYASSGESAIASTDLINPDLILLDVMMPGVDGFEVCQKMKALPHLRTVPIIMVTALNGEQNMAACLTAGADDYICKPINRLVLKARVSSMLRIRHQYKQLVTFKSRLEVLVKERTDELHRMLYFDDLTSLPSQEYLLKELRHQLKTSHEPIALVYLDCDQFSLVKISFGHQVSNQLLVAIANRLRRQVQPSDQLYRVGEDRFCFLLKNLTDDQPLKTYLLNILDCFKQSFIVENFEIYMTVSIGVALSNNANSQEAESLIQEADTAVYQAKIKGKEKCQIFDPQIHINALNRLILESDLKRALEQQAFFLNYQPIINLKTGTLDGFEALVRWRHPEKGLISPGVFIPSMETTGLIVPLGMFALREACIQLGLWHQMGHDTLSMSVNLSVRQFASPTLLQDIDRVLSETGVKPEYIKLEITESAIMENSETAIAILTALQSRKIRISIDDFGTGYSSLGYLHKFPVNDLKIDQSFVREIQAGSRNDYVVKTILLLSKELGLSVIAEGIETPEQLHRLQELNCNYGQGYYFAKPGTAREIETDLFPVIAG